MNLQSRNRVVRDALLSKFLLWPVLLRPHMNVFVGFFFFFLLQHMQMWHRLDMYGYGYYYRRCFWYDADVMRDDGRLLLTLARVQTWSGGMYRCLSDNITDPDNSSLPFKLTVHCKFFSFVRVRCPTDTDSIAIQLVFFVCCVCFQISNIFSS